MFAETCLLRRDLRMAISWFLQLLLDVSESQFLRDVSSEDFFLGRVPSHAIVPSPVSPVTRQLVAWSVARSIGRSVAFRASDRLSDQASDRISNRPSKPPARTQSPGGKAARAGRISDTSGYQRFPSIAFPFLSLPSPSFPSLPFFLPSFLLLACLPSSLLSFFLSFALPLRPPPCRLQLGLRNREA